MGHFIYLRQTNKDFGSFAKEILPVADQFLIKRLKEECERSLIDRLDMMDIDGLVRCIEDSHIFNLKNLAAACAKILIIYMQQNNDVEPAVVASLIKLTEQCWCGCGALKPACDDNLVRKLETADDRDSFLPLLTIARQHDLGVVTNHCVRWLKSNFTQLKALGFIDGFVNDKSENGHNMIHCLLESMAVLP